MYYVLCVVYYVLYDMCYVCICYVCRVYVCLFYIV